MLSRETHRFAYPSYPDHLDDRGFYLPDSVLSPLVDGVTSGFLQRVFEAHVGARGTNDLGLSRHRLHIPDVSLSLKESGDLVVRAFEQFDPSLGDHARSIVDDNQRWRLRLVAPGEAGGQCHPANCETNRKSFSVIEYNYDRTINDAVYMAHEIGHLFAFDAIETKGGLSHPHHLREIQAYYTQHILYHHLLGHTDPLIRAAGQTHFVGEATRSLYALAVGAAALDAEKASNQGMMGDGLRKIFQDSITSSLGQQWKSYSRADMVSERIDDRYERDNLGISNLHEHAAAAIISGGLLLQALPDGGQKHRLVYQALFSPQMTEGIVGVFDRAGIKTDRDVSDLFCRVIPYLTHPLQSGMAATALSV